MIASSYVNMYAIFHVHYSHPRECEECQFSSKTEKEKHGTFRENEATYKKRWWNQILISCNVNLKGVLWKIITT